MREQLMRQASRIAVNRTVAGVHYPVDSSAGQYLGLIIGQYVENRGVYAVATGGTPLNPAFRAAVDTCEYDGAQFSGNQDFDFRDQYDIATGTFHPTATTPNWRSAPVAVDFGATKMMQWLWKQARAEWP